MDTATESLARSFMVFPRIAPQQFPKKCHCGHVLVATHADMHSAGGEGTFVWRDLHLVGVQEVGDGEKLELRDCLCGSTLAIWLEMPSATDTRTTPAFGVPAVRV